MSHKMAKSRAQWGNALTRAAVLSVLIAAPAAYAPPSSAQPAVAVYPATGGPPWRTLPEAATFPFKDLRKELANKTTGTFTVTSVGDMFWKMPVSKRMSPQLRELMQKADTTVGNLEGGAGWDPDSSGNALAELGVDLLAPGEFDGGWEGFQTSVEAMGKHGIKIAGAGANLDASRRPQFHETAQGRIALVSACPADNLCGPRATPARPGVNPLGMTIWNVVTAEQFNQLSGIQASILARRGEPPAVAFSADPPPLPAGRLMFMGQRYMIGDKPGGLHYEPDPIDEQSQVLSIRNAKELSDFVIFHMHDHLNPSTFQQYSHSNYPADYLRPFIHKLIDNGLDMYVGTGVHTIQGIEIYKGRPIFYNQGNLGVDLLRGLNSQVSPEGMTATELGERRTNWVWQADNTVAYMANTTYKDGRLTEVRIYPVDIGLGSRPWSREQIPMTPSPAMARTILEQLQKFSEPYGTKIAIENNIGIIRVPPEETAEIGGDLVIPGRRMNGPAR